MLESRVAACDEAVEVAVDATVGLAPVLDEDGVVADCDLSVLLEIIVMWINIPFEDRLPKAAALLPCTSILSESVNGMRTSKTPMFKSAGLRSSLRASTAMAAVISDCTLNGT